MEKIEIKGAINQNFGKFKKKVVKIIWRQNKSHYLEDCRLNFLRTDRQLNLFIVNI